MPAIIPTILLWISILISGPLEKSGIRTWTYNLFHSSPKTKLVQSDIKRPSPSPAVKQISLLTLAPRPTLTLIPTSQLTKVTKISVPVQVKVIVQPTAIPTAIPTAVPPTQKPADTASSGYSAIGISGNAQDLLNALNDYRRNHGVGNLSWDGKLGAFAQSRADYFVSHGGLDGHAGFNDFIDHQNGFNQLGFWNLGENSGYGFSGSPKNMIENIFAKSPAHDSNQLNAQWTFCGIGTSGSAVDVIFGANRN